MIIWTLFREDSRPITKKSLNEIIEVLKDMKKNGQFKEPVDKIHLTRVIEP